MENQVTHEQMNSLKALADTNIEISNAKEVLFKLQETETQYIIDREKRVMERINKIVQDSGDTLAQAYENYHETTRFYETVSSFASFLSDSYESFRETVSKFDEKCQLWEQGMLIQEKSVADLLQIIKNDKIRIENDRKGIEAKNKSLEREEIRLIDMRGTLEREIERLNNKKNG